MTELTIGWDQQGVYAVATGAQVTKRTSRVTVAGRATIGATAYDLLVGANANRAIAVPAAQMIWLTPGPKEPQTVLVQDWLCVERGANGTWHV